MNKSLSTAFSCAGFQENYPDCCQCNMGQTVSVQENKRKFVLDNPKGKKICRIRIDGCVINGTTKKCDYLVLVCEQEAAYFVELKGRDFPNAVEQITTTIQSFQQDWQNFPKQGVYARAVLSQSPPARAIKTPHRSDLFLRTHPRFPGGSSSPI